jgi:hypothetical protein
MQNNHSLVTATTSCVIAGLDPAIHHFQKRLRED